LKARNIKAVEDFIFNSFFIFGGGKRGAPGGGGECGGLP